ncbi:MAG TPA: hypothetical protein PLO59_07745 [Bacteroidia bacterium]|nr:hypothetical protein [Bacteroidia bacterium]
MKKQTIKSVLFICLLFTTVLSHAQNSGKKPAPKPKIKPATKCTVYFQGQPKSQLKVTEATAWCDSMPLLARGDNGIIYKLKSFDVMVIQKFFCGH